MKTETPDQIINPKELLDRLSQVKGSKIITVTMLTEVKLNKKHRGTKEPCPYTGVLKRTHCKVMVGTDFQNGVNNRRGKEGEEKDFEAQPHAWANHTDKPIISTNKAGDQYYANLRVLETYETSYSHDGKEVDREELRPYQTPRKKPTNQGVEDPIEWRMPKIFPACSISSIKTDGQLIEVQS
jgi:hypothetical protein